VRELALRLGRPELGRVTVHVTGTKGKGSVTALVAAGLRAAGLATGHYSSPHVERLNERVHIGATPIGDEALAVALERVLDTHDGALAEGLEQAQRTSWFDLMSLAGFVAFRDAGLEAQVIEVGLGGRLDSTNIVAPDVCVITNIDLEHTQILGSTRARIAGEKAGILKAGAPVVSGIPASDEAGAVVLARARELGVPLREEAPCHGETIFRRNLRLARAALDLLGARGITGHDGARLHGAALTEELARAVGLPGRLELRRARTGAPVLFDGAHVPSSLALVVEEALREPLRSALMGAGGPRVAPVTVLAVHHEKDAALLLAPLCRLGGPVVCTTLPTGVHRSAQELATVARELGLEASAISDPVAAFDRALELAGAMGGAMGGAMVEAGPGNLGPSWVLVTGSLYLVGALRSSTEPVPAAEAQGPTDPGR